MALDAAARGDFETFHDLAWRTVQTGAADDPDLLYLLARAQSLSGRPHDALVMLERLVGKGVWTDAATNDDFLRVRALPGWSAVEAEIDGLGSRATVREQAEPLAPAAEGSAPPPTTVISAPALAPAAAETPAPSPAPIPAPTLPASKDEPTTAPLPAVVPSGAAAIAPPPEAAPAPLPVVEAPVEEAARFATEPFAPGGLAYDGVSHRFVFGDLAARKLKIVAEGMHYTVNLVSAPSAGFHDVQALEIDTRRGDLWVVSASEGGAAAALHKLQLVSGRPLATYEAPAALGPLVFTDVAVTPAGVVVALDREGRRVLALQPGAAALDVVASLDVAAPASLAPDGERVVYVSHRDGIARVDLGAGVGPPLVAPAGLALGGFEWIRRYRDSLVGVQRLDDGARRVVRLTLGPGGRSVVAATVIKASIPATAGPTSATISGDDLYYLARASSDGHDPATGTPVEVVVERIRLRQ